ncbi:putative transcriptional regulator [Halobacteriovorax marinus SJ]|uniref:Transcriptional regulator n=1 Tax=Halobacteriovorax marinus (strain ATCC BAA-682 / DSM 15412 / SJ) TaxID=862908 RepID=E1WXY2_HALMS|nr:FMN-binding negative transcriptional regulator [Halobacteriovorax marinus]CBW25939.1 putative transcriptional regulator [Halobacteriovorax marinus SJ]
MFRPKHFKEDEEGKLLNFIEEYPLGLLVTGDFEANLIPITITRESGDLYLNCHVARVNTQLKSLISSNNVLIVFRGPEGYVTPNVYQTKKEHGKAVPTWNYSMVQAHGQATVIDEKDWILDQINSLTNKMEEGEEQPWKVSDAPDDYIDKLVKIVVGIKIKVERLEGVFKTSQNQPIENRIGVKKYFSEQGNLAMADLVSID